VVSESGDAVVSGEEPTGKHAVIRSRDGGHFRIPLAELPDFVLPEGTVVIQWIPGRYLAIPPERLLEYRMSDVDLVQVSMDPATARQMGPPRRRITRSTRLRRGL
jgi:hypothetical protein